VGTDELQAAGEDRRRVVVEGGHVVGVLEDHLGDLGRGGAPAQQPAGHRLDDVVDPAPVEQHRRGDPAEIGDDQRPEPGHRMHRPQRCPPVRELGHARLADVAADPGQRRDHPVQQRQGIFDVLALGAE
jgi:hypothetical protein